MPGPLLRRLETHLLPATAAIVPSVRGAERLIRLRKPPAGRQLEAFLGALYRAHGEAPTACAEWSVHALVAHLAAGCAEITRLVDVTLDGEPTPPTRPFMEREAPFRDLPHRELRRRLVREGTRTAHALERLAARPNLTVTFTGRAMTAADLVTHCVSELALHRWDIAGEDGVSEDLLSDPALATHLLTVVASMNPSVVPALYTRPPIEDTSIAVRAAGQPDVVVRVRDEVVSLHADEPAVDDIELEPWVRTLLLWGRRPARALDRVHRHPRGALLLAALATAGSAQRRGVRP